MNLKMPRLTVTLSRKLVEGAIHAIRSVIACREGISDELLGDIADQLEAALRETHERTA